MSLTRRELFRRALSLAPLLVGPTYFFAPRGGWRAGILNADECVRLLNVEYTLARLDLERMINPPLLLRGDPSLIRMGPFNATKIVTVDGPQPMAQEPLECLFISPRFMCGLVASAIEP